MPEGREKVRAEKRDRLRGSIALTHRLILLIPTPTPEQHHKPLTSSQEPGMPSYSSCLERVTELIVAQSGWYNTVQDKTANTIPQGKWQVGGRGGGEGGEEGRCLVDKNRTWACSHCAR